MYIGLGIFLLVLGAILYFAVEATFAGIDIQTIGLILMIGGVLAILLSFIMQANRNRRRDAGYHATRESHVDPNTGTRVDRTDVDPY
jgi:uncharacterized membrane protein affecting hemolysin expression